MSTLITDTPLSIDKAYKLLSDATSDDKIYIKDYLEKLPLGDAEFAKRFIAAFPQHFENLPDETKYNIDVARVALDKRAANYVHIKRLNSENERLVPFYLKANLTAFLEGYRENGYDLLMDIEKQPSVLDESLSEKHLGLEQKINKIKFQKTKFLEEDDRKCKIALALAVCLFVLGVAATMACVLLTASTPVGIVYAITVGEILTSALLASIPLVINFYFSKTKSKEIDDNVKQVTLELEEACEKALKPDGTNEMSMDLDDLSLKSPSTPLLRNGKSSAASVARNNSSFFGSCSLVRLFRKRVSPFQNTSTVPI